MSLIEQPLSSMVMPMGFNGINICHVAINEHAPIFAEVIDLLGEQFSNLGISVCFSRNHLRTDCLNVLIGHIAFLHDEEYRRISLSGAVYIVFQAEVLCSSGGAGWSSPSGWPEKQIQSYLDFLKTSAQIWDYSPTNKPFLEFHGCSNIHIMPIGFSHSLQIVPYAKDRDIDVLFYGAGNERRKTIIDQLQSNNIRVKYLFGFYGADRNQMISSSKIVINIHQFNAMHLEEFRISFLLNNQCFVVSESADRNPYPGGIVFADYANLVECCQYYLQPGMEKKRELVAATGLECLRRIPMQENIRLALSQFEIGPK